MLPEEQDGKEFPGSSNILPCSFSKTLEQESFIFCLSSGTSATQNPTVPDSSLINQQTFPFKAGMVMDWKADELLFHDQLTSHQHANPSSHTEASYMRKTRGREVKSPRVLFSYFWTGGKKKKKTGSYAIDSENKFCSFNLWTTTGKSRAWESVIIHGKETMSNPDQVFLF